MLGAPANYILTRQAKITIADEARPPPNRPGHAACAGRVGRRRSAAQLRRQRQRRRAVGRGDRRRPRLSRLSYASVRVCAPEKLFADPVPCPNGPARSRSEPSGLPEGTQQLLVRAQETAGNVGSLRPITVRVDNTPPGRVDSASRAATMAESERLRGRLDQPRRRRSGSDRGRSLQALRRDLRREVSRPGDSLARLAPGSGVRGVAVSLWRRDAAGNESEAAESVPVTLRYDPDPPGSGSRRHDPSDPTLVAVEAKDSLSGLPTEQSRSVQPVRMPGSRSERRDTATGSPHGSMTSR